MALLISVLLGAVGVLALLHAQAPDAELEVTREAQVLRAAVGVAVTA